MPATLPRAFGHIAGGNRRDEVGAKKSAGRKGKPDGKSKKKNPHGANHAGSVLAEWTGLEPATPGVTGRYSNRLNYHSLVGLSILPHRGAGFTDNLDV